jgi:parallel beta-helix repeat protein
MKHFIINFCIVISLLFVQTFGQQVDNKELGRFLIGDDIRATHFSQTRTDISIALQNALDTLAIEGGGKIVIAPGTYYISQNINIGSNTHIDGYGIKRTIIQLVDFAPIFQNSGMLRCIQNSNVIVSNLTINGNKHHQNDDQGKYLNDATKADEWYGRYGIYIEGSNNIILDGVYVSNFQLHGIVSDGNVNALSSNINIHNSYATYNDFEGIFIDQTVNVSIMNTTTKGNGRTGYNFISNARNILVDNSFSFKDGFTYPNAPGCGIQLRSIKNTFQNITITNSVIVEPKDVAICLNKVSTVRIENNNLYAKLCVEFKDSSDIIVIRNKCINPRVIREIKADSQNENIVITENNLGVGFYTKHTEEFIDITIGYSNKATRMLQQGVDAYEIVQQSLDDIKFNGGGILRFEAGIYILSSYVEVGSNTAIIGAGINDTVLQLMSWANPWWIPNTGNKKSGFIRSVRTQNLYFANITIDGNKKNQHTDKYSTYGRYGFFTEAVDNVTIDGMGVINFQGYGFDPHGIKETMTWSRGLTIKNSYSYNNDWDGYTIDQSSDVLLENNVAYGNGRHGFNIVTGSYNVMMKNNIAYDNGFYYYQGTPGCGVAIQNNLNFGTKNISVINSIFENNDDAGICIKDVADIIVENNTIANVNYTKSNVNLCVKIANSVNVISNNNVCNNALFVQFDKKPIIPKNTTSPSPRVTLAPTPVTSSSKIQLPSYVFVVISIILTIVMI